jgi:hypothetical protein
MNATRFITQLSSFIIAFAFIGIGDMKALGQDGHSHTASVQTNQLASDQKNDAATLLKIVRESTERFQDVSAAEAEGYVLTFGCVSGSDYGAMGLHYVNFALVSSGVLDPTRPQIVIYEPTPNGRPRLIGADYLVLADTWNKTHSAPPQVMGQLLHLFESPNRFGLPAFYTLHVWAWKENPNGAFVNWHPKVSCETFSGLNP